MESLEEEQERWSLLQSVNNEMEVTHPIIYDTYDLCECNKENQLSIFKVAMLKEICSYFDIAYKYTGIPKAYLQLKLRKC